MEKKMEEKNLMSVEELQENINKKKQKMSDDFYEKGTLYLRSYEAVSKFKSVRRAIKRGLVSPFGDIYPKRPFNNKANTCKRKGHHSRVMNELKKIIYAEQKRHLSI